MEVETDERDRQREMEEIEEIRKQIVDNRPEDMDEQVRSLSFGLKLTHQVINLYFLLTIPIHCLVNR